MVALAMCLTVICLASLLGLTLVVLASHKEQRKMISDIADREIEHERTLGKVLRTQEKIVADATNLAQKVFTDACLVARSQQESATKYVTSNAQTANLISKEIDSRVAARIKVINAKPGSANDPLDPIEDPPSMPDVFQSGFVTDESEIEREMNRPRKMHFEYPIRDTDYDAEEI